MCRRQARAATRFPPKSYQVNFFKLSIHQIMILFLLLIILYFLFWFRAETSLELSNALRDFSRLYRWKPDFCWWLIR
jgi:hypothetical protein